MRSYARTIGRSESSFSDPGVVIPGLATMSLLARFHDERGGLTKDARFSKLLSNVDRDVRPLGADIRKRREGRG